MKSHLCNKLPVSEEGDRSNEKHLLHLLYYFTFHYWTDSWITPNYLCDAMEVYLTATIVFLILFFLRIFVSCCLPYIRENGCPIIKSDTSVSDDESSSTRGRRHPNGVFVIDVDGISNRTEVELPSYEQYELPPPAYEDAVKLPPFASNQSNLSNQQQQSIPTPPASY